MGRGEKFNDQEKKAILQAIAERLKRGEIKKEAIRAEGISVNSYYKWGGENKNASPKRKYQKRIQHETIHVPEAPKADTKLIFTLLELLTNEVRKLSQ